MRKLISRNMISLDGKLREAEVGLAKGQRVARGVAQAWAQRADLTPLATRVELLGKANGWPPPWLARIFPAFTSKASSKAPRPASAK